jgi:uncharacterized ParB-like nuclease family protein
MAKTAQHPTKHVRLPVGKITCDPDVQPRVKTDPDVVRDYAELLKAKVKLPPVHVFFDGDKYWLAEGFHRVPAHKQAGRKQIEAIVHQGSKSNAQWHALQSNKTHGLRRTNDDKKRAVMLALQHPNGANSSDHKIADVVGVSVTTVGKYRKEADATIQIGQITKRLGRNDRMIDTAKIGKNKKNAEPSQKPETDKPADPRLSKSGPVDQVQTGPRGDEHNPEERGAGRKRREPEVVQPDNEAERQELTPSEESVGPQPKRQETLIEELDWLVTDIQRALGTILRREEVAALPETHGLLVLLHGLENAAEDLREWLASQHRTPGGASLPDAADPDEATQPAQGDAEEEMAQWTA